MEFCCRSQSVDQTTGLLQLPVHESSRLNFFPDGYQLIDSSHGQWIWYIDTLGLLGTLGRPANPGKTPHWSQAGARRDVVNGDRGYQRPVLAVAVCRLGPPKTTLFYTVSSRLCILHSLAAQARTIRPKHLFTQRNCEPVLEDTRPTSSKKEKKKQRFASGGFFLIRPDVTSNTQQTTILSNQLLPPRLNTTPWRNQGAHTTTLSRSSSAFYVSRHTSVVDLKANQSGCRLVFLGEQSGMSSNNLNAGSMQVALTNTSQQWARRL